LNYFKRHIPNFANIRLEPETRPFKNVEELMTFEEVQHYRISDFSHFALDGSNLMAIYKNGECWLVGFVTNPDELELPKLGLRRNNGKGI